MRLSLFSFEVLSLKRDKLALSPATFKLMEIMLISARMWIFQYLWYWPKVEPIKMQISAKWKVSGNRESLTDRGFPQTPTLSQLKGKTLGNMWWWAELPFEFLAVGLNIVLCADPFVMPCVAVKNKIDWWHVSVVSRFLSHLLEIRQFDKTMKVFKSLVNWRTFLFTC